MRTPTGIAAERVERSAESERVTAPADNDVDDTAGMSELEKRRAKYLKQKRERFGMTAKQRQDATLQKLTAFQATLSAKR